MYTIKYVQQGELKTDGPPPGSWEQAMNRARNSSRNLSLQPWFVFQGEAVIAMFMNGDEIPLVNSGEITLLPVTDFKVYLKMGADDWQVDFSNHEINIHHPGYPIGVMLRKSRFSRRYYIRIKGESEFNMLADNQDFIDNLQELRKRYDEL